MAAAEWPQPPRDGVTLWHVTDTHISNQADASYHVGMLSSVGSDVEEVVGQFAHGRVHTGDLIDGSQPSYPDTEAKNWIDLHLGGPTDLVVPGNHDYVGPLTGGFDQSRNPARSLAQWESVYGRTANQSILVPGPGGSSIRVLALAPLDPSDDFSDPAGNDTWTIEPATLAWLDSELSAHSEPTWIACHYMLQEQGAFGAGHKVQPETNLVDLISSHPHVIGWLSGHAHWGVTDGRGIANLAIGNRNSMPAISGPSALYYPGSPDRGVAHRALFVTYRDADRVEIRFRDHGARKWIAGVTGEKTRVLTPS